MRPQCSFVHFSAASSVPTLSAVNVAALAVVVQLEIMFGMMEIVVVMVEVVVVVVKVEVEVLKVWTWR